MKLALIGSRYFGALVLGALLKETGVDIRVVVAPAADDRLALAAQAAGLKVHVQASPKVVGPEALGEDVDLVIAAHTHARVSNELLARARLGGVGYHPSLLPRHRGIAAVEWTVLEGDPIAGGSVYYLADGWDAGAIAAQDWCFVQKGEDARSLWERALAPMGLKLLTQVVRQGRDTGALPQMEQDTRFATRAPKLGKAIVLRADAPESTATLAVTVLGTDRAGIVRQLAQCAQRHGASWASSQMSRIAGEFAGMVQLLVPHAAVEALSNDLRALESAGLKVQVAVSGTASTAPSGYSSFALALVGDDRVGIVSQLAALLAERGVSIESLSTEVLAQGAEQQPRFRVNARLAVPASVEAEALRSALAHLAQAMLLDITLDAPAAP